mgnify:FL=1|jgi:hypothetical protein
MLGLLRNHRNWIVKSNVESGEGFVDILIKPEDPDEGILIELKYSKTFDGLEKACERAMEQVKNRRYDEALREEGRYLEYDGNNYTGDMKVHSCEQSDWESKTDL